MSQNETNHNSVNRFNVPIGWFVSAVVTLGGGFYWLATLNTHVQQLMEQIAQLEERTKQIDNNSTRLTKLETEFNVLGRDVNFIMEIFRFKQPAYSDFMEIPPSYRREKE